MYGHAVVRASSLAKSAPMQVHGDMLYSMKTEKKRHKGVVDVAKTPSQQLYSKHLDDPSVGLVIGIGPAGCGKTLLPCAHAIQGLARREVERIVITRPTVAADEQIGFLPGSLEEKMLPWMIPIYDCFKEYVSAQRLREYMVNEEIEICPLSFMRGRTFHKSWIIADEVQNTTVNQMRTLLTRAGQGSKVVLTGDLAQCDFDAQHNGLQDFLRRYALFKEDGRLEEPSRPRVEVVEFNESDVLRSELVKVVLDVYRF